MDSRLILSPAIAAAILALGAPIGASAPEAPQAGAAEQPLTFFCKTDGATPVTALRLTAAEAPAQVHPILSWTAEYFPTEQAEQLCQQAAQHMQVQAQKSDPGQFSFITGELDGRPAICLETELEFDCGSDRLIASLATDQDADEVLLSMTPEENHPPKLPATRGDFPLSINPWPVSITSILDGLLR